MIVLAITTVIMCFVFLCALLVGVFAFGVSVAPLILEAVMTVISVKWLLYVLRK